jgi:hypothetical protein
MVALSARNTDATHSKSRQQNRPRSVLIEGRPGL